MKTLVTTTFLILTSCAIVPSKIQQKAPFDDLYGQVGDRRVDLHFTSKAPVYGGSTFKPNREQFASDSAPFEKLGYRVQALCNRQGRDCSDLKVHRSIHMEISTEFYNSKPMTFLSVVTLTLVPNTETHIYRIRAKVLDEEGKVLKTYLLEDGFKYYYQLFLLFVAPFQDYDIEDKIVLNLIKNVVFQAKQDHLLD